MRRRINFAVICLLVLLVGGLVIVSISRVRNAASLVQCRNNLRQIGLALGLYHDTQGHFPTGTLPNPNLLPEKRLSWAVAVWPDFMNGGTAARLDKTKPWDAEENCPPWWRVRVSMDSGEMREEPMGQVRIFQCPAVPVQSMPSLPSPTHYVGIAGLGEEAAELPLSDSRAGFFGYDRKVSRQDIKDGLATTLALADAMDGGPWTAGGRATVRGLSAGQPYLGEGGQFAGLHRDTKLLPLSSPIATNVLFADASVRRLTPVVGPEVFEAMATIAGGESVNGIEE